MDKIVVRPIKADKVTAGGIIIPDTAKRPPLMGIVVAAGPGRHVENPTPWWLLTAFEKLFGWLDIVAPNKKFEGTEFWDSFPRYGNLIPNPVKPGDKILFHKFSGTAIDDVDDNTVILMGMDDVLAILDPHVAHCFCSCHKIEGADA